MREGEIPPGAVVEALRRTVTVRGTEVVVGTVVLSMFMDSARAERAAQAIREALAWGLRHVDVRDVLAASCAGQNGAVGEALREMVAHVDCGQCREGIPMTPDLGWHVVGGEHYSCGLSMNQRRALAKARAALASLDRPA